MEFKRGDIVEVSRKAVIGGIPAYEPNRGGVGWVTRVEADMHTPMGSYLVEVRVLGAAEAWWYQKKDLKKIGEATLPEEGGSHCHGDKD